MRLLSNFEPIDYDRNTLKESFERDGVITMKGVMQRADVLNQNGRIYPLAVLEREVRNYQKFIIENRALGELDHPPKCVPLGTDIFTSRGWIKVEDVRDDEIVATLNVKTDQIEFQRITARVDEEFEGELVRMKNGKSFDFSVTLNHRVLLWDRAGRPQFIKASDVVDLANKNDSGLSHSGLRRAGTWVGEDPETVEIAGKTIDSSLWAAFLGIWLAEGHCSGVYSKSQQDKHFVCLSQNAGQTCDDIRELLRKLPWDFYESGRDDETKHGFTIKDAALHAHLLPLGGSHDKYVPKYAKGWSPRLINVLLEWMLAGDGRHRYGYMKECTVPEYCTTSVRLADDVYELMLKLGHGGTIHTYQPDDRKAPDFNETGRMILSEDSAPMNIVYQHSSKGMSTDLRFMKVTKESYKGRVYCVETPNQTWLMRQNNKVCWTGNSIISLKNASHIVREAYLKDGVVYGTIEVLHRTPSGAILKGLIESGVKLGISSRGVGSTKPQGDHQLVQDDFQLICFDMVSEPSTTQAFMIPEGKQISGEELKRVFTQSDRIDRVLNDILR